MYTFWKKYDKYGSFYKVSGNTLLACPQLVNGDREVINEGAVCECSFDSDEQLEVFLKDMSELFKTDITIKFLEM
jgi:hypothetical protein